MTDKAMVERIRVALPRIPKQSEDYRVLSYVFQQLQPAALDARSEDKGKPGSSNIIWCAKDRLRRYETKEAAA